MDKFCGNVGYAGNLEVEPGIYEDSVVERKYFGDILDKYSKWNQSEDSINDKITVNHRISIIADEYALNNFKTIRYVYWLNVKWEVTKVSVNRPRLELTLGGEYVEE